MEAKHKFKSNNVNTIFKQTVMENVEPSRSAGSHTASNSPRDSSSPAPAGVSPTVPLGASGSRQASLSTATGHYKLGMVSKDAAAKQAANGWTATPPPPRPSEQSTSASASNAAASTEATTTTTTAAAAEPSTEEPKKAAHQPTEEELAKKGIFVASRYTSTNDLNWSDDEDDEWQPPTNKSSLPSRSAGASLGRSGRLAPSAASKPAASAKPAKPTSPAAAAGTAAAPSGESGTPGTAWTRKTEPAAMSIKELREQAASSGPGHRAGAPHGIIRSQPGPPPFRGGAGGPGGPGGDGLSRFRMGGGPGFGPGGPGGPPGGFGRGPPPFRGGPPGFGGGPHGGPPGFGGPGFNDFGYDDEPSDWRSRRAPGGGPVDTIVPTPHPAHREIPDRFKIGHTVPQATRIRHEAVRKVAEPRPVKPEPKNDATAATTEAKNDIPTEAAVDPKAAAKPDSKPVEAKAEVAPANDSQAAEHSAEHSAKPTAPVAPEPVKVEPKVEKPPAKSAEETVAEQKALMRAKLEKAKQRREAEALADRQRQERLEEARKKELEAIKAKQEEELKKRREENEKRREEQDRQRAEQREREREARERAKEQRQKDQLLDKQSWHTLKAEAAAAAAATAATASPASGGPGTFASRLQPARLARVPRSSLPKGPRETHSDDPREKHDPRLANKPREAKELYGSREFGRKDSAEDVPSSPKDNASANLKDQSTKKPEFRGVRDFREELKAEGPGVTVNLPSADALIIRPNFNLASAIEKAEAQEVRPAHFSSTMVTRNGLALLNREPRSHGARVPLVRTINLPGAKPVILKQPRKTNIRVGRPLSRSPMPGRSSVVSRSFAPAS